MARAVFEALEDYAAFGPPGWTAPSLEEIDEEGHESLADEDVYCVVAEAEGKVVGQITVLPATQALHPNHEPTLGHIGNVFVTRDFWGTGLAGDLHRAALDAARGRGFSELRLFVPAGQARARRFYERVSWLPIGNQFDDPISGFTMVEYRYRLLGTGTQRVRRVGALDQEAAAITTRRARPRPAGPRECLAGGPSTSAATYSQTSGIKVVTARRPTPYLSMSTNTCSRLSA